MGNIIVFSHGLYLDSSNSIPHRRQEKDKPFVDALKKIAALKRPEKVGFFDVVLEMLIG